MAKKRQKKVNAPREIPVQEPKATQPEESRLSNKTVALVLFGLVAIVFLVFIGAFLAETAGAILLPLIGLGATVTRLA